MWNDVLCLVDVDCVRCYGEFFCLLDFLEDWRLEVVLDCLLGLFVKIEFGLLVLIVELIEFGMMICVVCVDCLKWWIMMWYFFIFEVVEKFCDCVLGFVFYFVCFFEEYFFCCDLN